MEMMKAEVKKVEELAQVSEKVVFIEEKMQN